MIILRIIGYLLLFIFTIIALLVITPINYSLECSKYEKLNISSKTILFGGLFKVIISVNSQKKMYGILTFIGIPFSFETSLDSVKVDKKLNIKNKTVHKTDELSETKTKKNTKNKKMTDEFVNNLNIDFIVHCLKYINKIWTSIKPKQLTLYAIYGFEDPYYTGLVCSFTNALSPILKEYDVNLSPSFGESILSGELKIKGRITIIVLIYVIVRFMVTNPIKNILKNIIRI